MFNSITAFGLIIGLGLSVVARLGNVYELSIVGGFVTFVFLILAMIRTFKDNAGYAVALVIGYFILFRTTSLISQRGYQVGDLILLVPAAIAVLYCQIALIVLLFKSRNDSTTRESTERIGFTKPLTLTELTQQPKTQSLAEMSDDDLDRIVSEISMHNEKKFEEFWQIGVDLLSQRKTEEALAYYQTGLYQYPYSEDLYKQVGDILSSLGRHKDAAEYYRDGLNLGTISPETLAFMDEVSKIESSAPTKQV